MKRNVNAKCLCWSELHSWCSSLASALIALSPLCWSKWVSTGRMKASQRCLLSGGHLKTFHKVHLCPCFLGSIKIACFLPNVSCESRQNWTANSFCSFLHTVRWDECESYCWSVLSNQVLLILSDVTCGRHPYMERIFWTTLESLLPWLYSIYANPGTTYFCTTWTLKLFWQIVCECKNYPSFTMFF